MVRYILPVLLVGCLLFSCNNKNQALIQDAPLISLKFKDDLDREIALPRSPERVISLAPNITEVIFAIGGEKKLVAVSQACNYPFEATELDQVQTYPEIHLESMIQKKSDLVLGTDEVISERYINEFENAGLKLYFQKYSNTEDVYRNIINTGKLLDLEENAVHLADSLRIVEQRLKDSTDLQIKYGTMILISVEPLTIVAGKSFINQMIIDAGGKNVFDYLTERYAEVTPQAILQANPEVVIIPSSNDKEFQNLINQYPNLANLKAVADHRVYAMDPNLVFRPGPRVIEGAVVMANILHSHLNPYDFLELNGGF